MEDAPPVKGNWLFIYWPIARLFFLGCFFVIVIILILMTLVLHIAITVDITIAILITDIITLFYITVIVMVIIVVKTMTGNQKLSSESNNIFVGDTEIPL